jgi:hypothetical protein
VLIKGGHGKKLRRERGKAEREKNKERSKIRWNEGHQERKEREEGK